MSDNAPNKTQRKLTRTGDVPTLQGIVGDDAGDLDVFGYEIIYTTGEFTIDRETLLAKAADFDIPEWMLPNEVPPHRAFGRMVDDLLEGREEVEFLDQRVRFVLDRNDSNYSYTLDARVYFTPEQSTSPEGEWVTHKLGVVQYDSETKGLQFIDRVERDSKLAALWFAEREDDPVNGGFRQRAKALFERHQDAHTGKDVNNMTYYLVDQWTDSIRLRDACYFVPANHTYTDDDGAERSIEDLIEGYRQLYAWLNDHADKPTYAQKTEMHVIEIMDTDRQRAMVEAKVGDEMQDLAHGLFESIVEGFRDDDTLAEEVATQAAESLDDLDSVADEYRAVLNTKLSVKRVMAEKLEEFDADEAGLIEQVLKEVDAAPADLEVEA